MNEKLFCLEVWGDMACFTRPELKVERVSYDVITPSAARGIFDAILFKPYAMRWQVTKIEVLSPIRWTTIRRNEVGAVASAKTKEIFIEGKDVRQPRNSLLLRDVRYRIWAKLVFIPVAERPELAFKKHKPGADESAKKYFDMFMRRANKGQCFNQPYLGTREFSASFQFVNPETEQLTPPINESRDLGIMLYDMDFSDAGNIQAMFYRPKMVCGVIDVPPVESEEILK